MLNILEGSCEIPAVEGCDVPLLRGTEHPFVNPCGLKNLQKSEDAQTQNFISKLHAWHGNWCISALAAM